MSELNDAAVSTARTARRAKSVGRLSGACSAFVLLSALIQPNQARAQESQAIQFEDIVVTARGREERLTEVPLSITAFSAEQLERSNVQNVIDLARSVPNFNIVEAQQPGVAFINVRGIGQARNGESPLAVVVDGVQISSAYQITQQLLDVERVEILRGPQGALYGRNAIGGAIVITTRQPGNDFDGAVSASYGTGQDWRFSGYVNGPIVQDKVYFKASGYYRDFDGDIDSLFAGGKANPDRQKNVRVGLYMRPTETIDIGVQYGHLDQKASGAWYSPRVPGSHQSNIVEDWNGNFNNLTKRKSDEASFKLEVDLGGVSLRAVTGYTKINALIRQDLDLSPLNLFNAEQITSSRGVSQEVRLSSLASGPLEWSVGAYYLDTNYKQDTTIIFPPDPNAGGFNPAGSALAVVPTIEQDGKSYAAFGQLSYRFDTGLELTAGGRYDVDKKKAVGRTGLKFESFQPRISAAYFFNDTNNVYASMARGYRSGGYNPVPGPDGEYGAEKVWTYELGYKALLLDRRIDLGVTLFYNDISDRQLYAFDLGIASQIIRNPIDQSEAYGLEFDLGLKPAQGLDLVASFGLMDTKIKTYTPSAGFAGGADFTGNELPYSSHFSYAFSAQYQLSMAGDWTLTPRFEVNGSSPWYWEISNADKRKSVTTANARLAAEFGKLAIRGYVENLFKKRYNIEFLQAEFNGAPFDIAGRATGRRWGIELRYQY